MHALLPRLAGYAECHQGCTEPVQIPFLGSEVPTEVGLEAPVVTVASVASMGIGPKRGGVLMAADGRLICANLAGDIVFFSVFFYLPIVGLSPTMGRFF
jgi:hypothetical protein